MFRTAHCLLPGSSAWQLAARRLFLSYYSFATLYSVLAAGRVRIIFASILADSSGCSLFDVRSLVLARCNWLFAKGWSSEF